MDNCARIDTAQKVKLAAVPELVRNLALDFPVMRMTSVHWVKFVVKIPITDSAPRVAMKNLAVPTKIVLVHNVVAKRRNVIQIRPANQRAVLG